MAKPRFSKSDTQKVTQRIEVAKKYYEQTFRARDKAHLNLYVGQHWKELGGAEASLSSILLDNVTLNYIGRDIDLKVAGLAAEPPIFRFKPRGTSYFPYRVREMLARVWEVYLPYVWREGDIHRQMKAALRDQLIFGRGWVGIDWKIETQDAYVEGGRPDKTVPGRILYDNPIVQRIAPARLLLDPEVDTLSWEQAAFIGWEMAWPLERIYKWARSDDRVNMRVASSLKGDETLDPNQVPDIDKLVKGDDFHRATITRYHERERNLVIYVAKEKPDEPLLVVENPYEFDGYPFEPLFARPWADKYDAIGYAERMRPWQRLFNLIRSKEAQMVRTATHKVVLPSDMGEEEKQALESDLDRVFVFVNPGTQFQPREINTTGFPPELIQAENALRVDLTELSQIRPARRGLAELGVDTATESANLTEQSSIGDRDEQVEWEDFNRRVCRKAKALIEQFGDAERIAAVSPEVAKGMVSVVQGEQSLVEVEQGDRYVWVKMTPQQIADEAEIELLAGSMGVRQEAVERAQLQATVRTIIEIANAAPLLEAMGVNPQEAAKMLATEYGSNKVERLWQAPKPLPAGMVPAGLRPTPNNGQTNLQDMLKSVVQAAVPGQGAAAGGGA